MPAYRVSAVWGGGYSWELRKGLPAYRVSAVRGRGLFLGTEEGIASLPSVCSAGAGAGVIPGN